MGIDYGRFVKVSKERCFSEMVLGADCTRDNVSPRSNLNLAKSFSENSTRPHRSNAILDSPTSPTLTTK